MVCNTKTSGQPCQENKIYALKCSDLQISSSTWVTFVWCGIGVYDAGFYEVHSQRTLVGQHTGQTVNFFGWAQQQNDVIELYAQSYTKACFPYLHCTPLHL